MLEPPLLAVPSAAAFFDKAARSLAAYRRGDRDGVMAGFLSMVSSLGWETCRGLVETHVPGGMAQAMTAADNFFGSYLPALEAWRFGAEEATAIRQPVLSVVGTESERLFMESHELLHSWFPHVEDCVIEDVGHLLHMQRPAPVAEGVARFIARHPMASASYSPGGPARPFSCTATPG